jgi:choline monooxygenase
MLNASVFDEFKKTGPVLHGLPGAAYTEDTFFQLEQEQVFTNNWVFVGYAHQLPKTGDVKPITVSDIPLFLIRDEQKEINAFHNVCRHRNLKLIDESGNCGKLIRCPYHSWSYDLCGSLKNAPFFGGAQRSLPDGFKLEDNNLHTVRCEVWHDWVFINLASNPMPFEQFLAPIQKRLGDTDVSDYLPVATLDLGIVPCNWKLLMENFIEPYHVQFVHKSTTEQPLEDHYTVVEDHCLGSAVELSEEQMQKAKVGTLGVTSYYLTLFPNFVMGTYQPDQMGIHLNVPISAEATQQYRVIYTHKDAHYSSDQIQALSDLWRSVHLEDHEMCIRLQKGRHSPLSSQGGFLSPHWENSVRRFQELIAEAVSPGLKGRGSK